MTSTLEPSSTVTKNKDNL